jgi:hypothetical protein
MKKLVILCTVILLVLLPAVSLIGCQPTTTEGQTYTNLEYGFSVEYPDDWEMEEGGVGTIVQFTGPPALVGETMILGISIEITAEEFPMDAETTLEDFSQAGELILQMLHSDYKKLNEYSTTIGGEPAKVRTLTYSLEETEGKTLVQITEGFFFKENLAYLIAYFATPESHDEYLDCFELVMSSFRFE